MSKLKKYACAHIPDMSPKQAEAVLYVLDAIIDAIWDAYGKKLNHILTEPPPPRPENKGPYSPDSPDFLDLLEIF